MDALMRDIFQSRMVRNCTPTFIWCVRRDAVDPRHMREDQVINHYGKATFTTKVGPVDFRKYSDNMIL